MGISQVVVCIDDELLEKGREYYLDICSIMGDSDGSWSGMIYRDPHLIHKEGRYYLKHFKSFGR